MKAQTGFSFSTLHPMGRHTDHIDEDRDKWSVEKRMESLVDGEELISSRMSLELSTGVNNERIRILNGKMKKIKIDGCRY